MSVSNMVKEVETGLHETQNQRDARVEELWRKLDPSQSGELDLKGLHRGFQKIDHPMKNADDMVKKILHEVDTNGDGKIQYEEFRTFVEQAERQLLVLFKSIDKDGNGKLDMRELQAAFKGAKLTVSNGRLSEFFNDMDMNNDGYVSFDEWRDFLLFIPARGHESKLRAILTYYDSVTHVTPEGDSLVSDEILEGLGMKDFPRSLLQSLFGSLLRVAYPAGSATQHPSPSPPTSIPAAESAAHSQMDAAQSIDTLTDGRAVVAGGAGGGEPERKRRRIGDDAGRRTTAQGDKSRQQIQDESDANQSFSESDDNLDDRTKKRKLYTLTEFIPDPGYFVAGAIAGGVSRTATAPLDRLKVYLLVNTKSETDTAVQALKSGKPVNAVKNAARPLGDAVRDLYRAGGLRSFFAGNGLNVIKIMPESAIKFGSYEAAKRALANLEGHGDAKQLTGWSKFTAGGLAGMIAQFCVYPVDTLKFRLQCETVEGGLTGSALVRQTARKMYADGGMRSAYRGVTMGLIGMFPYSAIDMGMFEFLKKTYRTYYSRYTGCHEDDANPGNVATGIIGATSGAFGASVVYPLNVVRTRLQTQGTVMHPPTYAGIWDATTKTVQKEGWRGLYKGLTPNLLKVAPALSITWVVYENSKKLLSLH